MDNTLNTFAKGMIKDVAETLRPEDSYEDAQDMKLNAGNSASEYIMSNVKGNDYSFTVPDIPAVLTLELNSVVNLPEPWADSVQVNMTSGTYTSSLFGGQFNDIDDYFDQIVDVLNNDPAFNGLNLNVARQGNKLRIWSDTDDIISINPSTNLNARLINTLQAARGSQVIIGWESINEKIYLFTTDNNTSTGGIGAIFEFIYNQVTFDVTLRLIYTEELNFTTLYPISNPGGVVGIYETPFTQGLYWTDRLNNLRSMNVADPNIMAVDPFTLSINIDTALEKPTLEEVVLGGSLDVAHYQVAYALKTDSGSTTSYSHTSNSIYITESVITGGYADYIGADPETTTNNAIRIKIDNIDTSYSFLELIVLKKVSPSSTAEIYKVAELEITDETIIYTYTGDEPAAIITEIDFNRVLNLFDKCHAISKKDNILFAANTKGSPKDLDFDARAYRFDANGDIQLKNISGFNLTIPPNLLTEPFALDETSDAINPDQTIYKYQADGETLGGQGPHISYTFKQRAFCVDGREVAVHHPAGMPSGGEGGYTFPYKLPWSNNLGSTVDLGENQIYNEGNFFSDFKSPFFSHYQKGYRREETYRFAFVPIKNSQELYAKWIADIKMPAIWEDLDRYVQEKQNDPNFDVESINVLDGLNQNRIFPLAYTDDPLNGSSTQAISLGVKFNVNLPPEIAREIDGFRIKRVKLEPLDRTVIAQGIIHLSHYDKSRNKWYLQGEHEINSPTMNPYSLNGTQSSPISGTVYTGALPYAGFEVPVTDSDWIISGTQLYSHPIISFHSPDFLFGTPAAFQPGDKLKVIQGMSVAASTLNTNNRPAENTNYHKLYWGAPVFGQEGMTFDIVDAQNIQKSAEVLVGNYEFINRTPYIPNYDGSVGEGSPTTVIALDGLLGIPRRVGSASNSFSIPFSANGNLTAYNYQSGSFYSDPDTGEDLLVNTPIAETNARPDKYFANYIRENLGQYGGQGYAARQQNVYINTGTDVKVKDDDLFYSTNVFGGDTYLNVFDTFKTTKNYREDELGMESAGSLLTNDSLIFSTEEAEYGKKRKGVGLWFPCESFVNTDMRHGYSLNGIQNPSGYMAGSNQAIPNAELFPLDYGEDFLYNFIFSMQMDTQRSFPKPVGQSDIFIHPVRIWASNTKVYGETRDSWRYWNFEKYIDIEGDLGEIRQLITYRDQLLAWQERGMGVASVNERSITTDSSGTGVILGKSGVLPRFDYISESIGSWHQFSFAVSPRGVIFWDAKDAGIYLYSQNNLRDVTDGRLNSWLFNNTRGLILNYDGPIGNNPLLGYGGIIATYDNINKEFLMTFFDRDPITEAGGFNFVGNSYTIAYADKSDVFTSFRSFKPNMYINDQKNIFTPKPFSVPSQVYVHERGDYGVFYGNPPTTSSVTTVVNKEPFITKIFDNIRWFSEIFLPNGTEVSNETFSSIETFNTYQTTGVRTQFRRLMREWKHAIQYQFGTKNRIRSHYVRQKFEFLNNNDKEFRLHYIMNLFRKIMK